MVSEATARFTVAESHVTLSKTDIKQQAVTITTSDRMIVVYPEAVTPLQGDGQLDKGHLQIMTFDLACMKSWHKCQSVVQLMPSITSLGPRT